MRTNAHIRAGAPVSQIQLGYSHFSKRLAANTRVGYSTTLSLFFATVPEIYEQITAEHVEKFVMSFKGKNSSKNNQLYRIKSFCGYAENYLGLPNPAARIKPLKVTFYKQRCLSDDEYQRILAVCSSPSESAVVKLLCATGLRRSEYRSLSSASICEKHLIVIGKGNKKRIVPLNGIAIQALSLLNLSKSFKKPDSLMALCRKLTRKSGVEPFSPHSFRHYFATRLVKAGVPLAKVSKILGHSSIAVTEKTYLHLLPSDTLGCTDVLDF